MPVGQPQHSQQAAGMSSQAHMGMHQQQGSSQQMRQGPVHQHGYTQAGYSQPGLMRQQPSGYPTMGQAYSSNAGEQSSRPMSPPGLPRGPSNPMVAQSPRSQVKSPLGGYLGPQMIRPQMVGNQMAAGHQMAGSQVAGHQMAGSQMAGAKVASSHAMSPKSSPAMQPSSLALAPGGSSNGGHQPSAQAQLGPQPSNSGSSRPNSASSAEGSGSVGQGHGALVPQGRTASSPPAKSQQAAPRFQAAAGQRAAPMQQPGYGQNPYSMGWNGGMRGSFANPGQPGMMQGVLCTAVVDMRAHNGSLADQTVSHVSRYMIEHQARPLRVFWLYNTELFRTFLQHICESQHLPSILPSPDGLLPCLSTLMYV